MLKEGPMIPKVWGGSRERKGAGETLDKIMRSTTTCNHMDLRDKTEN